MTGPLDKKLLKFSSSKSTRSPAAYWLVFVLFLLFDLIKAGATQTETSLLKQYAVLVNVGICLMIMISQQEPSLKLLKYFKFNGDFAAYLKPLCQSHEKKPQPERRTIERERGREGERKCS